jgi:low affinity Fe/Cu permease
MKDDALHDEPVVQQRRILHRTEQLPLLSRILYRLEHYSALPAVALAVGFGVVIFVVVIVMLRFPSRWVSAFEVAVSAITVIMVFSILHIQGREQAATQRKLDELIHALPGADESLMMLEEASPEDMLEIEHEQRSVKSQSPDTGERD